MRRSLEIEVERITDVRRENFVSLLNDFVSDASEVANGVADVSRREAAVISRVCVVGMDQKTLNTSMKPSAASRTFSTHYSMHSGDERHFALLEKLLTSSTPGSLLIVRSELSVRPKHLSDRLRP